MDKIVDLMLYIKKEDDAADERRKNAITEYVKQFPAVSRHTAGSLYDRALQREHYHDWGLGFPNETPDNERVDP